jgi:hypothetical protein
MHSHSIFNCDANTRFNVQPGSKSRLSVCFQEVGLSTIIYRRKNEHEGSPLPHTDPFIAIRRSFPIRFSERDYYRPRRHRQSSVSVQLHPQSVSRLPCVVDIILGRRSSGGKTLPLVPTKGSRWGEERENSNAVLVE